MIAFWIFVGLLVVSNLGWYLFGYARGFRAAERWLRP